jgi:two-component system, cell cycle sensor histidine kinase and response regulator CckA
MTPAGTETILLAEDEDSIRRVATRMLEGAGYTVISASDGAEALKLAGSHVGPIHLLITDLMMPDMNGVQLAERIHECRPGLPTLFLSGYADSTMVRQGPLDPAEHFLQKPFASETLLIKVREILGSESTPAP